MTYVAGAAIAALVLTSLAWAALVRNMIRQQARERDLLINQIMHLSGRTWTPPPVADVPDVDELVYADPTQQPDWE